MRAPSIDIIRGFAILIMIFANSYPYLYPYEYCPKLLRLFFSSAAPVFIFLSGVSLRLAQENGKEIKLLILRSFQILFFAIIVDIFIWSTSPFITMDVLYLISYSLLFTIFLIRLSDRIKLIIAIGIILFITVTNNYYNFELDEVSLGSFFSENSLFPSLHHVFIDGWFPVFPWTGFTILGYLICKNRLALSKYSNHMLLSGSTFIIGFALLYSFELVDSNPIRDGYTEIFYPVTIPFLFYVFGLFLVITSLFHFNFRGLSLFSFLGKLSLPIYFIHIFLIKFYIPFFTQSADHFNEFFFLIGIITLYLIIFMCVYLITSLSNNIKKNRFAAFLLGV
jgi:peptidoglycan/LPS O-acetylase OafA/YrhL